MKHAQKLKKFSPLQNLLRACVRKFEVHEINTYHVSRRAFCHRRRLCALQLKAMISADATSTVAFCWALRFAARSRTEHNYGLQTAQSTW